jgi:hypothetical protein
MSSSAVGLTSRGGLRWSEVVRKTLSVCGPLAGLSYILWHEIAALQWALRGMALAGADGIPPGWLVHRQLVFLG